MNLMFWKKKAATDEDSESAPESPDDSVISQDPPDTSPADPEVSDTAFTAKAGLFQRIKSQFSALSQRFKRSPAPMESEGEDLPGQTEEEADDAEAEAGPEKTSLIERIKLQFSALSLRFKKPAASEEDAEEKGTHHRSKSKTADDEVPKGPGFIKRTSSGVVSFLRTYKTSLIATLIFVLLAGTVYTAWDIIFPPLVRRTTEEIAAKYAKPPAVEPIVEPVQDGPPLSEAEALKKQSEEAQAQAEAFKKQSEEAQAQAEALKKQSEEAQARAEARKKQEEEERAKAEALKKTEDEARALALKKKRAQSLDSTGRQSSVKGPLLPNGGDVTVGSKDSKATAMTLKEAIEAMNANSGGYSKKPDK